MSLIWPIQPRLTLGRNGELSVGGVSPDGSKLVTFTRRAELTVWSSSPRGQFIDYSDQVSGPIQIWDLKTGSSIMVPIPGQKSEDQYVKCHTGEWLMRNDYSLQVQIGSDPCRQDWFLFSTSDREGRSQGHRVLNLLTGELRQLDSEPFWNVSLSPSGRWCMVLEKNSWSPKSRAHRPDRIVVYETASMKPWIEVEQMERSAARLGSFFSGEFSGCFSADETYFAVADGLSVTTKVFDMATGNVALSVDRCLCGIAFAKHHDWIAGCAGRYKEADSVYSELEVWDIPKGELINRRREEANSFSPKFIFFDEDRWLIGFSPSNSFEGEDPVHARLDLELSWCFDTDEVVINSEPSATCDVTISRNFTLPAVFAPLYTTFNSDKPMFELFEWTTGKRVYATDSNGYPIFLATDRRTFIVEYQSESQANSFLWWLNSMGVPTSVLWGWLPTEPHRRWDIIDIKDQKKIGSIPGQYQITHPSRDQRTLVTTHSGFREIIKVWDLPFRRSTTRPYLWASLIPAFIIIARAIMRGRMRFRVPLWATLSGVGRGRPV